MPLEAAERSEAAAGGEPDPEGAPRDEALVIGVLALLTTLNNMFEWIWKT